MGFLKRIKDLFGGAWGSLGEPNVHYEYVRCARCGEPIRVRVNVSNELSPQYGEGEGAYYVRKGVVGSGENLCFQTIELELYFDSSKRLLSRDISGGEFIARETYIEEREGMVGSS